MLSVLIFIIIQQALTQSVAASTRCDLKREIQILLCAKKNYEPEDVIAEAANQPISISFTAITNSMELTIPKDYSQANLAEYKSFTVIDSCVVSIEENYFANLDNQRNKLKIISLSKVRCLHNLETKSFSNIGRTVERLNFKSMPDLYSIEKDFFDSFAVLKRLSISNTSVTFIPDHIFSVLPRIEIFHIINNKLRTFPVIPSNQSGLLANIKGHGNPFDCSCRLMEFIRIMTAQIKSEDYRCATPEYLNQTRLQNVGDLCSVTTEEIKNFRRVEDVSLAQIRLKVIIAVAVVLVVLVLLIIAVLVLKNKKKAKEKAVYMEGSPSKIVFQNEEYNTTLLQNGRQMV